MERLSKILSPSLSLICSVWFFLLLIGQLVRFFRKPPLPDRKRSRASLAEVLLHVLAAFVFSRFLLIAGGALAKLNDESLLSYLQNLPAHWTRWDADHYLGLMENGYVNTGDARLHLVFFPLYPLFCRAVCLLTGFPALPVAYAASNLAFVLSGIVMFRLTECSRGSRCARRAVWLTCLSPLTLFCSVPYTEAFFLLTTLTAVYLARRGRFFWAVVFGALSANTRLCGMASAIPIFYEMARQNEGGFWRRWGLSAVRVLPVSLGLLSYLLLNKLVSGDWLRFLTYQSGHWGQNFGSLWNTVSYTVKNALTYENWNYRLGVWIPQILFIVLTLCILSAVRKKASPGDMGYALVYFYVSVAPTWLLSGPRYLSALYALYPALGMIFRRKVPFACACVFMALTCVGAGWMYVGIGTIL